MKTHMEIVLYGWVASALTKQRRQSMPPPARISKTLERAAPSQRTCLVTLSHDLDDAFVRMFRRKATPNTRLLILNEGASTDRLLARILDLQIRTPQRCYVVEGNWGAGKTVSFYALLRRLVSTSEENDEHERILDARIEEGVLHVVSPEFNRLDVPIEKVPSLAKAARAEIDKLEIDDDGAFIYWPKLDVHLGWATLQQCVNPAAALKARQKNEAFNRRYGRAVQKVRDKARLKPGDISGLSEKQLRRVEAGECRLTSNAIGVLAKAHRLEPNEYMKKLAEALN